MNRDFRTSNNWSFVYAEFLAKVSNVPLVVVCPFLTSFGEMGLNQYRFHVENLKVVEKELKGLNIGFVVEPSKCGNATTKQLLEVCAKYEPIAIVTDFFPLRLPTSILTDLGNSLDSIKGGGDIPLYQVDSANIVPCWVASPKKEVGAR